MKCTAHSSITGQPCKRWAIQGGTVCATHGGQAPQVKAKALERIQAAAVDAAVELARLAVSAESEAVRVSAIKDLLDRAGLRPNQIIEQDVTVHAQDDFTRVVAELEAELARGGESRGAVAPDSSAASDRT